MRSLHASVLVWLVVAAASWADTPALVFSVKTWKGDYATRDIPGGVEVTPTTGTIYTINADGTGLKRLVESDDKCDYPLASPDGRWIYYQSKVSGETEIYRCKSEGTGVASLTPRAKLAKQLADFDVKTAYGPSLSADGSKMVFTVHDGKSGRVVIANADGSEAQLIAPELGYIYMARLSPQNDRVVFSGPARGYRLMIAELPAGKPLELTPDHPDSYVPQFTPEGKTIIFVRRDGDVYRVDTDGKNLKRLTEGNKYVEFRMSAQDKHGSTDGPDISPDGKQIAYIARKDDIANVFVMDVDGKNARQVTSRTSPCGRVRWSPDGKTLAFVSFEGKLPQLFTVPATGGESRHLTKLEGAVYFASWTRN